MDAENSNQPAPEFIESILRSLKYWQQQTQNLQPEQVKKLDKQRRNMNTAVQFGLSQPETWEATATVLLQAFNFAEWRGYWGEWIPILQQALASAPEKGTVIYGRLQNRLGQLYRLANRHQEAIEQHEEALQLAKKLAHDELKLVVYSGLSEFYLEQSDMDNVEKFSHLALNLAQTLPDMERIEAFISKQLGEAAAYVGNWPKAIKYQKRAIHLWRIQKDPVYLARSLMDLGVTYIKCEDFEVAKATFEEAGQILQPTINEMDKARIYLNLGVLYFREERWSEAEKAFLQINTIALRECQEFALLARLYNNLGNVQLKLSRWDEALKNLTIAVEMFREMGNDLDLANSLGTLAHVCVAIDNTTQAISYYEEAIVLLKQYLDSEWAIKLLTEFSDSHRLLVAQDA